MPRARTVTGILVLAVMVWQFTTVPVWRHLLAGIVHGLPLVLLGAVVVPAGALLFLCCVIGIPPRSNRG